MKKGIVMLFLAGIFTIIILLFWYKEWIYSLPTPIPENYQAVGQGRYIELSGRINPEKNKPVFLHFFNPHCPCSRFNITHFKSLVRNYGQQMTFIVIVMTDDKKYNAQMIREKFGLTVPVIFDSLLAQDCGVYSTPQAVLLDERHTIFYRGNYNKTRYCTDKKTNYAELAIAALLNSQKIPAFNEYALKAYGCSLPKCTK